MSVPSALRSATLCVRGGLPAEPPGRPLLPPIVQSTTYVWGDPQHPPPISYAREGNPTVSLLEKRLAALEGGNGAVCFASGIAAIDALLRSLRLGARVVAGQHVYGGTTRLFRELYSSGLRIDIVDSTDVANIETSLATPADLVLVETPSNPTLRITDLRRAASAAHRAGALLAVDNTFLTPLSQRPLELGADVAVHSTTKYLEGHDATLGGAVVVANTALASDALGDDPLEERLRWIRKVAGAVLSPFEAWLTLQGTKTLHLRTREQWSTAAKVASLGRDRLGAGRIYYPGLSEHPGHAVHRSQASGDGGIVGLDLGTAKLARAFLSRLRVFTIAENLGATESIATHPSSMTHAGLTPARRKTDGISEGLVRLSVGVEDPEDLLEDLARALDATLAATPREPA